MKEVEAIVEERFPGEEHFMSRRNRFDAWYTYSALLMHHECVCIIM